MTGYRLAHSIELTEVIGGAARARVHDLGGGTLSVLGVFDGDRLKIADGSINMHITINGIAHLAAELAVGVSTGGKRNNQLGVIADLAAVSETSVEPSCLLVNKRD